MSCMFMHKSHARNNLPLKVIFSKDRRLKILLYRTVSALLFSFITVRAFITSSPDLLGCWHESSCVCTSWYGPLHGHPIVTYLQSLSLKQLKYLLQCTIKVPVQLYMHLRAWYAEQKISHLSLQLIWTKNCKHLHFNMTYN